MQVQNLYQSFEIEYKVADHCQIQQHKHTFFELIYITEGEGTYHINNNKYPFHSDNLFMLMPMEEHYTTVSKTTGFLFIRFNKIFLDGQKGSDNHNDLGNWIKKLEYIFRNNNRLNGCIIRNNPDKPLVKSLTTAILQEHLSNQALQKELMQQLINTLLTVVARNIALHFWDGKNSNLNNISFDLVQYIHSNIYNPEKLKAESIASHFNISLNYISEFFKKHTGENLQQYIINYKLSLVEIRLQHSDMRLNEIAYELGFTDESHLTRIFKKYKGINPAEYRKNRLAIAS
jgi:AraC-like DNA-binding protein